MLSAFARALLRLVGWRVDYAGLPGPKGVVIVYPHTSNWDFILGLLAKWTIGEPMRWIGKESLFRGLTGATLGRLMRMWGGRPVDRHARSGAVEQLAQLMANEPWFWLALSPEGTRRHTDHLRSGFWHLALKAKVPLGLAYIDYARKRIGVVDFVTMTGDEAADLATLRAFYADKIGRYPEKASAIAFRPAAVEAK
jgi:1-acyl-sn-glycerol-3-phosphate acyltransferase